MSYKWQIYCITEESPQYQWADNRITECPNDPGHDVLQDSATDVDTSVYLLRFNLSASNNVNVFKQILHFHYEPLSDGIIRRIRTIAYITGPMTSMSFQIFDLTHKLEMLNVNITNTVIENSILLPDLSNVPTEPSVIEISIKRNGGNNNCYGYVDEIIFYS